jgi:hypothetical protein
VIAASDLRASALRAAASGALLLVLGAGVYVRAAGAAAANPLQTVAGEQQVKAEMLVNFIRFVEWPAPPADPVLVAVAGDDAFAGVVEAAMRDRRIEGRAVAVRRLRDGEDPACCQVLFISSSLRDKGAELLQRARGPILTIGETVQFLRDGGIIRFHSQDSRVRFQINRQNAAAAGLKVSAGLLKLGTQ